MNTDLEPEEPHQPSKHVSPEEKSFLPSDKTTSPQRQRSALDAIGVFHLVSLAASSMFLLGSLVFLGLLWRSSINVLSGYAAPGLWHKLVDRQWIIRAVTISSVVIRTSVAVQVGLVTPMVASLFLERAGTRIGGLPMLSIMRTVGTSPYQMMQHSVRQLLGKTAQAFNGMLLVVLLTSVISQFTSTILLLDFSDQRIQNKSASSTIQFGLNRLNSRASEFIDSADAFNTDHRAGTIDPYSGVNYWKSSPVTYSRFAEYRQPPVLGEGVADTGLTYRAFLPFASSDLRRGLRKFTGVATVLDFRTVCVRPRLTIERTWSVTPDLIALEGFAELDGDYSMLSHRRIINMLDFRNRTLENVTKTHFNCTLALDSKRISSMGFWRASLCAPFSAEAPILKSSPGGLGKPSGISTDAYILFNATGSGTDWKDAGDSSKWESSSNGSWTTVSAKAMNNNPSSFSATMCFTNPSPSHYYVHVEGTTDGFEPSLTWNNATRHFDTHAVRRLYGSTDPLSTHEDRGVLALNNHHNWTSQLADPKLNVSTTSFVWAAIYQGFDYRNADIPTEDGGALLTPWTDSVAQGIHRTHIAIFQDVLRSTYNPALALQTLFTILAQSAYYDFLPQLDVAAPAQYTVSMEANIPHQWTGFSIVVAILGIHVLVVSITTALFLAGTKTSMLGNAWQAVAQVVELVDRDVLENTREMRDKDVQGILRARGQAGKVVKVS